MAASPLVLGDVLCFAVSKYDKTTVKTLKSAIFDFYTVESLSDAKKILADDIDTSSSAIAERPRLSLIHI